MKHKPICGIEDLTEEYVEDIFQLWQELNEAYQSLNDWYKTKKEANNYFQTYLKKGITTQNRRIYVAVPTYEKKAVGFIHVVVEQRPKIFVDEKITRVLDVYVNKEWRNVQKGVDVG
jgi:hypothetical protein